MTTLAPSFLIGSSLFLQVMRTTIKSQMGSKLVKIRPQTVESLSVWKNPHRLIMGEILLKCLTLMPSFLDGSSSFLQVTRPTIKVWMSLNFGKFLL